MMIAGLGIMLGGIIMGLVIPGFQTGQVTNMTDTCINLQADIEGQNPGPVWFSYGSTKGDNLPFTTGPLVASGGHVNQTVCGFPLLPGHTYWYALENETGRGNEVSFTMGALEPHPTTSFGAPVEDFLNGGLNATAAVSAIWGPYMQVSGTLGMGLVMGGIFSNMALKQQSVRIPAIVILLTGGAFWVFMPSEFIAIAQVMMILALAGTFFWFFQQRR